MTKKYPVKEMLNTKELKPKAQGVRPKIIVSGIGTGGHYFPALVVAEAFIKRGAEVIFLVRKGYDEEKIARMRGLATFAIDLKGFYGKPIWNKIESLFLILYALYQLHALPKKVVGFVFGGFGSLSLIIFCIINRRSYYIFEPNRIPGRATKLFAARAKMVFLGMPLINALKCRSLITGIPIRREFKRVEQKTSKITHSKKIILFYGGSQGAARLNQLALELQNIISKECQFVIISGRRDYNWVNSKRNGRTKVIDFTMTPWVEIQHADLVISRSGALAGYEIIAAHKPVIFIPFPHAIDDHQYYNAEYFVTVGNARIIREEQMTVKIIAQKITELIQKEIFIGKSKIILDAEERMVEVILKGLDK